MTTITGSGDSDIPSSVLFKQRRDSLMNITPAKTQGNALRRRLQLDVSIDTGRATLHVVQTVSSSVVCLKSTAIVPNDYGLLFHRNHHFRRGGMFDDIGHCLLHDAHDLQGLRWTGV
jgi:hypothetical protein